MNENLHRLNEPRRPFTPCLEFAQIIHGNRTGSQFLGEQIGSRDGILDREINADAACRRHRVRRITDAKQPVAAPITETIDLHREQLDFCPVIKLCHTVAEKCREGDDLVLKLL